MIGHQLAGGVTADGRVPAVGSRQISGLEGWQGQGLDEVLRPVQPIRPAQPSEAEPASQYRNLSCCSDILSVYLNCEHCPWTGHMLPMYDPTWLCNDPADIMYLTVYCHISWQTLDSTL